MKKKLIALTLAASVMLTGAGYAYWTDQVTINNAVSTGEFNVSFVDQNTTRGGDNGANPYWGAYVKHEGRLNGPATVVSPDKKTVTTMVTNMYPGAYAQYYGTIANDGTIPAVFASAIVSFTGKDGATTLTPAEQELKDNLKFAFGYVITDAQGNKILPNPNSGDGRYYASGNIADLESKLNFLLANVRMEPGQKLSLDFPTVEDAKAAMESIGYPYNDEMHCITYTLNTAADNDIENQELGISMTINWKQHNAQ
ncbi:MAG: SipW-dependent-type signal peptide-containing protein [Desulfitobacterium sp.]